MIDTGIIPVEGVGWFVPSAGSVPGAYWLVTPRASGFLGLACSRHPAGHCVHRSRVIDLISAAESPGGAATPPGDLTGRGTAQKKAIPCTTSDASASSRPSS